MSKFFGKKKAIVTKEGPNTRSKKCTTAERGKQKKGESSRQREESGIRPEDFGFSLPHDDENERFQTICQLPHKQCRYQYIVAMTHMGIADNVLALANNVGLGPFFQANYLAYKVFTLEFLSTVVVDRPRGLPRRMFFQLGNTRHMLKTNELSLLLRGPNDGAYVGNHSFDTHELWGRIPPREDGADEDFNPASAKTSSIRNPAFRLLPSPHFLWVAFKEG